jgi:DNA modification methylase
MPRTPKASVPWRNRIVGQGEEAPDQILANPANWRTHPGAQRDALRGSLSEIGWVQQVIVNRTTGHLVDGHARVEEAISAGAPTVPVLYVELTPEEEKLVLASLDPIGAMAQADATKLDELLADLNATNPGLQALLDSLGTPKLPVGLTDPDDVPEVEPTTIKAGDLFALGDHRLMCGDSTKAEDVARLMGGAKVPLVFTSPPYAAQRDYGIGDFDWLALMQGVTAQVAGALTDDGSAIVNLGLVHKAGRVDRYWDDWLTYAEANDLPLFGWYVWDQGWGLPGDWGGRLAPSFEFLFHLARKPRYTAKTTPTISAGKIRNSTFRHKDGSLQPFTGNGSPTGDSKVPDAVVRVNRQIGHVNGGDHPAVFSVGLPEYCLPVWTKAGESVLDPFSGSGTTIIAAEQLGRRCYAMEIDARYVAVAIKRWEQFTGRKAEQL